MELNFEVLRIAAALTLTGIAAWEDYRTSYISDKWLFSMVGIGAFLTLFSFDLQFILNTFIPAVIIFGVGFLLYKTGQLGLGDVLLFVGLQLMLPIAPKVTQLLAFNFQSIPFSITVLTLASLFALIGSSVMYLRIYMQKKLVPSKGTIAIFILLLSAALLAVFLLKNAFSIATIAILLIPTAFVLAFKKQIYDKIIIQEIPISKIEDEDILAIDKMPERLVKKYSLDKVLTKKQVAKLKIIEKNEKIRLFPVCKILPRFGPYTLIGLIAALLLGDASLLLLGL